MTDERASTEEQALDWVIRQRDPGFTDWEAFTAWLEQDPEHAAAYDAVAIADENAGALLLAPPRAPLVAATPAPARGLPTRRAFGGWALAASLAAVLGFTVLGGGSTYVIETAPGEQRSLMLADGSRIDMNGATRLTLDRDDVRLAELDRGEALFTVVHDERKPFRVQTGGAVLLDVGTVFNVTRAAGTTEVAVSEGAVVYNPRQEALRLDPGRKLRVADGGGAPALSNIPPADVAAWRSGRLIYLGTPIAVIAADLSRNLGIAVEASPAVAERRFSGVIMLDKDPERLFARLSPLLAVSARREERGWVLAAGSGAVSN